MGSALKKQIHLKWGDVVVAGAVSVELLSCCLVKNSKHSHYDKDRKDTEDKRLVSSTSFFHHEASVIDQVALFIVLTALSLVTPLYSIITSCVDSIVTKKSRFKRRWVVIGLNWVLKGLRQVSVHGCWWLCFKTYMATRRHMDKRYKSL